MSKNFFKKLTPQDILFPQAETHTEEEKQHEVSIHAINYNEDLFEEKKLDTIAESFPYKESANSTWINIVGPSLPEILEPLGKYFGIHSLVLEDIRTEQRPKVDDYDDFIYLVVRELRYNKQTARLENSQVSIILGENYVISFQEKRSNLSLLVRERLRTGRIRRQGWGSDYLVYTLIDIIVDNYFLVLENMGESVEDQEITILNDPTQKGLSKVYHLKREMIVMRKYVWPLREVISRLQRDTNNLLSGEISHYLRDLYDHTIQVIDSIETFRDLISSIIDLHLSNASQKTNDIMKTLAIFATIFAPLTFLTGVWGMNFRDMPDLTWRFGYPGALIVMFFIICGMLFFFRKKKWI